MSTESLTTFKYAPSEIDFNNFDQCPEEYQRYVKRILSIQAYAELCGANEVGTQLKLAPDHRTRKGLAKIVYDEATHAYMLYEILEKIGVTEHEAIEIAEGKKTDAPKTQSLAGVVAVGDEENQWIDLILNNMLMDRAGGYMVNNFTQSSFAPWAKACEKILEDEQWHKLFGLKEFEKFIKNPSNLEQAHKRFNLWYTRALNFFGPPNVKSQSILKFYGIKQQSNEELRFQFMQEVKEILKKLKMGTLIANISGDYPYSFSD